jgi:hypothetical protein
MGSGGGDNAPLPADDEDVDMDVGRDWDLGSVRTIPSFTPPILTAPAIQAQAASALWQQTTTSFFAGSSNEGTSGTTSPETLAVAEKVDPAADPAAALASLAILFGSLRVRSEKDSEPQKRWTLKTQ